MVHLSDVGKIAFVWSIGLAFGTVIFNWQTPWGPISSLFICGMLYLVFDNLTR